MVPPRVMLKATASGFFLRVDLKKLKNLLYFGINIILFFKRIETVLSWKCEFFSVIANCVAAKPSPVLLDCPVVSLLAMTLLFLADCPVVSLFAMIIVFF